MGCEVLGEGSVEALALNDNLTEVPFSTQRPSGVALVGSFSSPPKDMPLPPLAVRSPTGSPNMPSSSPLASPS